MSSLRQLYDEIPLEKRLCHFCGKTILRNIDVVADRMGGKAVCHHGCISKYGFRAVARCQDCYALLEAVDIVQVDWGDGQTGKTCGCCGGSHIRWFRRRRKEVSS